MLISCHGLKNLNFKMNKDKHKHRKIGWSFFVCRIKQAQLPTQGQIPQNSIWPLCQVGHKEKWRIWSPMENVVDISCIEYWYWAASRLNGGSLPRRLSLRLIILLFFFLSLSLTLLSCFFHEIFLLRLKFESQYIQSWDLSRPSRPAVM